MLGSGYVIEHCAAAIKARNQDEGYRIYTTDCLCAVVSALGGQHVLRFADWLHPKPEDNRDAQQIVADITARAGLKVVDDINERIEPDGDAGT